MNRRPLVVLAKEYVDRSNQHRLDELFPMFETDATYRSSQFGSFSGLEQIRGMMVNFFSRFPDVNWKVDRYRTDSDDIVSFQFLMRATNIDTGKLVKRLGLETIRFGNHGRIRHIEVEIS